MEYKKNDALFESFYKAIKEKNIILITAATGFGKTRFLNEALKNIEHDYFSLTDRYESIDSDSNLIVIDEFQYIEDMEYLLADIRTLAKKCDTIIISSRSNPSKYFIDICASKGAFEIKEEDLALSLEVYQTELNDYLDNNEIIKLYNMTFGNALLFIILRKLSSSKDKTIDEIISLGMKVFSDHLKVAVFDYVDVNVLTFLLQVAVVDSFNEELARAISMNDKAMMLIDKAISYGSFISLEDGIYRIRPIMLKALRDKYHLYYSYQEYNEFIFNAGHYYESIGQVEKALEMYAKCNSLLAIKRILIYNSTMNPATGNYRYLKKYYEMLDEEEIKKNPVLVSGLAMLYSLTMDVNKSNSYYQVLINMRKNAKGAEAVELDSYINYLNVALPQNDVTDIFTLLKLALNDRNKKGSTPYGLTGNCPSIMNGGKDFTMYIKDYSKIIESYGEIIKGSTVNGVQASIFNSIIAEILFEIGEDHLPIMQSIIKARMDMDKNELDMIFAVSRIEILINIERGNLVDAYQILEGIIVNAMKTKNNNLLINLYAYKTWLHILADDRNKVEMWLVYSVDDIEEFYTTDRLIYLTKIKAYIYLERYPEAYSLIQKLKYYAENYHRYYILTELILFEAMLGYLTEQDYLPNLYEGLKMAQDRNLVRLISLFGVVMDKMIVEQREKLISMGIDNDFIIRLNPIILNMATRYPKLYNKEENLVPDISKTGIMILQLQSQGYSLVQISDRLQMNVETIRYHSKQNYKKLGASGSTEAVTIAKKMGLL